MLYGGGSFDRGEPLQTFLHLNPAAVLSHLSARTGKIEISSTLSAITTQYSGFRRQISVDFVFRKRENFHGRRRKCPIFAQFKTTRNANDLTIKSLAFLKSTRSRDRTGTAITGHRILSPACLPIPPSGRSLSPKDACKSTKRFTICQNLCNLSSPHRRRAGTSRFPDRGGTR